MTNTKPVEAKIWREAFVAFKQNIKLWWPWILGLTIMAVPAELGMMQDQLHNAVVQFNLGQPVDAPASWTATVGQIAAFAVQIIALYCFTVLSLQQNPLTTRPELSIGGFLYWFGRVALKGLVIIGVMLPVAVVATAGMILARESSEDLLPIARILVAIAVVGTMAYMALKYIFVEPLAASGLQPALKGSWRMTKGNWWRIFWHGFVLNFIVAAMLVGFLLLPFIALFFVVDRNPDSIFLLWGVSIFTSVLLIVGTAAWAVYKCTACQILYRETRQADPTFTLTTKAP